MGMKTESRINHVLIAYYNLDTSSINKGISRVSMAENVKAWLAYSKITGYITMHSSAEYPERNTAEEAAEISV